MRILFLCTGNSCRSILAESLFNRLAPEGFHAESAGSRPKGHVHPRVLALLEGEGIPTAGLASKSWDSLAGSFDLVVTLCDSAAGEECPLYLAKAPRVHWGLPDPDAVRGAEPVVTEAFRRTFRILEKRIGAFLALPAVREGRGTLPELPELEAIGEIGPEG